MKKISLLIIMSALFVTSVSARQDEDGSYPIRVEKSIMIPMRDGVVLSTDLYLPEGVEGKLPTILLRTPYNKSTKFTIDSHMSKLVDHGYAVAIQDMRGRYESAGRYRVGMDNRNDGYDTVSWLSAQPWSNKKIGTAGCSYAGDVQVVLAAAQHPNHVAAVPMAATTGYFAEGRPWLAFDGGAFELAQTAGWFIGAGSQVFYGPPSWVDRQEWFRSDAAALYEQAPKTDFAKYASQIATLPLVDLLKRSSAPPTEYQNFVTNKPNEEYFKSREWLTESDTIDVPSLFVDSWYDYGVAEALDLFNIFQKNAASANSRKNQFIIVAPSTHCAYGEASEQTIVGERDLGDARLDYLDIRLRWYDYWLKGIDNGITDMPKVQYYLMGKNEWRSANQWPLPDTQYQKFYLSSNGQANTRNGDGKLLVQLPTDEFVDSFTYDPASPVPSLGGQACCTGSDTGAGGYDQSEIEMRDDVLVYTSNVLEEGVEVTGRLEVVLNVSSSAMDTDFTAKLVDVYPDGRAFNIQEGAMRMRYRDGYDKSLTMQLDEIYQVRLDLHATSNYFGPGHRIRLEVSSSNFPRWDRNLNTGGNNFDEMIWKKAHNKVHHSKDLPSYMLLPIIK